MLPGFRFLLAAIMLSMSFLVFGFGAAALLRSAHEEFASNPSWRAAPEVKFAQPAEPTTAPLTRPVLATLRVEMPGAQKTEQAASALATPAPAETEVAAPQAQPEQIVADRPEPVPPPEIAKPESATQEAATPEPAEPEVLLAGINPQANEAAPNSPEKSVVVEKRTQSTQVAVAAAAAVAAVAADPAPRDDPPVVAADVIEPNAPEPRGAEGASEAKAAAAEAPVQDTGEVATEAGLSQPKLATLGGPAVEIRSPTKARDGVAKADPAKADPAKADPAKPDQAEIKKREQAKRAARNRRIAAERARLAALQVQQQLQTAPFFQQPIPAAARAR
jgi:hypothetical protein